MIGRKFHEENIILVIGSHSSKILEIYEMVQDVVEFCHGKKRKKNIDCSNSSQVIFCVH